MKHISLLIFALILAGTEHAEAQRQLERGLIVNPFHGHAEEIDEGATSWMHHWGGWLGFSRYAAIRDDDHLWLHQLGGYIELARFGTSSSLLLTSQIEFIADPRNEINFNPRSVFWEEGLLLTHRLERVDLQVGYYHRCKHDTDNLVDGEQRTLIFGSLTGRAVISQGEWQAALKTDLYTIRQDFRRPPETRDAQPDWDRLLGSSEAVVRAERALGPDGLIGYLGARAGFSIYSDTEDFWAGLIQPDALSPSGGLSAGVALRGERGELRFNIDYEYLPDTGMTPIPKNAHLVRFGIMAVDPLGIR